VYELSLFSGAGGGLLGTKLLGFTTIGYVEYEPYCQKVLKARIEDGILDAAPIFGDIRKFISEGYAGSYTGLVDVLTAGFPCQPFSVAGKQKGADDPRNMWPQTADVIRIVQPQRVLLENVPGLRPYVPVVIRDLRRLGYVVSRPLVLGADDVGAPHRRKRLWIMAYARSLRTQRLPTYDKDQGNGAKRGTELSGCGQDVALSDQAGWREQRRAEPVSTQYDSLERRCSWWDQDPADLPDTMQRERCRRSGDRIDEQFSNESEIETGRTPGTANGSTQPRLGVLVDGLASRLDLTRATTKGEME
jgi:DNA (cytosine-5)-methyltransferase 1